MADQNEAEVHVDEELVDLPEGDENEVDWQSEARKREGTAKRYKTQVTKLRADLEAERAKSQALAKNSSNPEKKTGFDYAEKAYLKASGIQGDEYEYVFEVMQATGKSLDDVLDTKYVQSELKERRETKVTKEAIPTGSKRSGNSTRDDVDYWIAKGTLPPMDQVELRRKVVDRKMSIERDKTTFTDRPLA